MTDTMLRSGKPDDSTVTGAAMTSRATHRRHLHAATAGDRLRNRCSPQEPSFKAELERRDGPDAHSFTCGPARHQDDRFSGIAEAFTASDR